ncbi:MAG TPA: hypothetical protein VI564_06065 [Candidatus Nanoarchaeia archaeon]|nr:hypothetical protein [Candidatus Nanoarchaeia archaeon]
MLGYLWGLKTVAIFDFWTFEHILSGISIGHAVKKDNRKHILRIHKNAPHSHKSAIRFDLVGVLFLGYLWEAIEHYLESGLLGEKIKYWFQGVESWPNRLIADPLMLVLGYYLSLKYPKFVVPARVLSILWLTVHIFIFPHSMYLQEFF